MLPAWFFFLIVLAGILVLSKYELSIVITLASFIFALLVGVNLIDSLLNVILDLSILILMIAVALIPILGGILEESGMMIELVNDLKVSKKTSLMLTPALFGLLPVAGGALMSAPIVKDIDKELDANNKVAINVWFRHMLILIYPLSSALIVASILAGLSIYILFLVLLIPFFIMVFIGYFTMVRGIETPQDDNPRNLKRALRNFLPIIIAPLIDFFGRLIFNVDVPEIYLLIGLVISIFLALGISGISASNIKAISKKMKIWRFPLLIFGMFWFLEVFKLSGVPVEISSLYLPVFVFILIGFFLGFATGRIQLPISILIPIYLIQFSLSTMILSDFVFIYSAVFLGYLITPIHPCVSYSINYFETDYKSVLKVLYKPVFISFGALLSIFLISLTF